jgi:tight adherence protein B
MTLAAPLLLLLGVLVLACAGTVQVVTGTWQKRDLANRTALDEVERRAGRLRVRADVWVRRTGLGRRVARRLAAAGLGISALEYMLLVLTGMIVAFVLTRPLVGRAVAVMLSLVVAWGAGQFLEWKKAKRLDLFVGQLPELARVLSNSASAGLALRTSIGMAAEELDDPAATELRHTAHALAVGHSLEEALGELSERLPSRELGVLVTTLVIQHRAGGGLVTALRNISDTLDARKDVRREIKTVMAGSVFTGYLVAVMGLGTLLLINLVQPGIIDAMLGSLLGQVALLASAILYVVGFLLIKRITHIDY